MCWPARICKNVVRATEDGEITDQFRVSHALSLGRENVRPGKSDKLVSEVSSTDGYLL